MPDCDLARNRAERVIPARARLCTRTTLPSRARTQMSQRQTNGAPPPRTNQRRRSTLVERDLSRSPRFRSSGAQCRTGRSFGACTREQPAAFGCPLDLAREESRARPIPQRRNAPNSPSRTGEPVHVAAGCQHRLERPPVLLHGSAKQRLLRTMPLVSSARGPWQVGKVGHPRPVIGADRPVVRRRRHPGRPFRRSSPPAGAGSSAFLIPNEETRNAESGLHRTPRLRFCGEGPLLDPVMKVYVPLAGRIYPYFQALG